MIEYVKHPKLGQIPSDWKGSKLSEVVDLIHGYQFRTEDFTDYGIAVIKIGNIMGNDLKLENLSFIDSSRLEGFSQYLIEEGDILMSLTGNIGRVIEVGSSKREFLQNYRVGKFIPVDIMELNKRYVKYLLSSPLVLSQFFKFSNQSAQANFGKQDMDKVWITIPTSIPEQQKITKILSTVDDKIEVIDQQITETQELKKGLMQRLLTKGIGHTEFKDSPLGEIPTSWDVVKLGNLVSKIGSGITPKGGREAYLEEGITFIRSQNVLRGSLKLIDVAFISQNQHNKMGNSKLQPEDVLLNITGASIGRSCVIPMDFKEGNVNQHVCIIRTNTELNSNFLSHLLNSSFGMNQIDKFQAGGNREGLNFQQIRSFDIPLPPLEEQEKIGGLLVLIEDKIDVLSEKKTHYQELKQGLMQQLLTGKIRVKV